MKLIPFQICIGTALKMVMLKLLSPHHFDCWIVVDKNIPYQQNILTLPCLVIVPDIFRNTLVHLKPLAPQLFEVLQKDVTRKIIAIKEGT